MRRIGAFVIIAALVVGIFSPSPGAAFGLRFGPLHFGLPFGHRYRHSRRPAPSSDAPAGAAIYDRAETIGRKSAQAPTLALLYPGLALSAIYEDIFSTASSSPWPFDYEDIFRTAFAKALTDQHACQPVDSGPAIVERMEREIRPTAAQQPLLQKLGGALGIASGYLAKSCPGEVPPQPVARLQLMEWQIDRLTMALDIVRQPLQEFQQSFTRSQLARFVPAVSTRIAAGDKNRLDDVTPACGAMATTIDWSIDQLKQSLQPTDAQRDALADAKKAFGRAASDLDAHCPTSYPSTPLARLEAIEAGLDAEWQAVLTIQVALANLESRLSDDQRARFDAMDFAAAR